MFDDYPQAASNAARRALEHKKEKGSGCGTAVGWRRANQLATREALSADTVKRTYSFLSRARVYNTGSFTSDGKEVCGSVMYAAWGGTSMLTWAKRKTKEMEEEKSRARVGEIDGVAVYTTQGEAKEAAEAMGCSGTHQHETDDGKTVYMPCASHDDATGGYRSAEGVVQQRAGTKEVEVRQEGDSTTVVGYAAVFNSVTDLGHFREQIAPEAFTRVMEESPDTVALLNHNNDYVLGRTTSGTLKLEVDEVGLRYELQLGNQTYARDLAESMRRGDISKSSFAFTIERESWQENVRTVEEVRGLYDISVVTRPAYNASSANLRKEEKATACGCNSNKLSTKAKTAKPAPRKRAKLQQVKNTYNMKNSDQLKSLRSSKLTELNALVEVAEAEARDYTEAEVQRQEQINSDIVELDGQIKRAESTEANVARFAEMGAATPKAETVEAGKMKQRYNLQRALNDAAQGRLSGVENEMHQEALREAAQYGIQLRGNVCIPHSFMQKRNVYGNDASQSGVVDAVTTTATEVAPFIEALRPSPIIESLGATQLTGFVGDIKIPSMPTDAASAPVEGAAATAFQGSMGSQTLSPQRFAAEISLTKEALNQASGNMSDVIARDFGNAIANAIDTHAFAQIANGGAGLSGVVITPAGANFAGQGTLQKATETGTNDLAASSAADIVNLWASVSDSGVAENGSFVMRPATAGHLMQQAQVSNGTELMAGNRCLGYNAVWSTRVPKVNLTNILASNVLTGGAAVAMGDVEADLIYFGDFSHLFWATWGGLSLTIDPFSGASSGTVKIVADQYFDAKLRHAAAVGYMLSSNATVLGADA